MIERPILMSGPMVRAILEGWKSMTRRVVKPQPTGDPRPLSEWSRGLAAACHDHAPDPVKLTAHSERLKGRIFPFTTPGASGVLMSPTCPYGVPGDRLYVRHAFNLFPVYFKTIPEWEGLYAAGTDGLVYRMDRGEPEALQGSPTDRGYLTVSLSRGEWVTKSVHRMVCEAFYGPPPFEGTQVRHMDGDRTNNRPENLDWGTQGDNWQDRKAHGRGMGEQHHSAKLTPADAQAIRGSTLSQRALARQYGVSQSTIGEIRTGKSWTAHAPGPRNAPAWKPWTSSIHMPRAACRLVLELTAVRVERLQEISDDECYAEGAGEWAAENAERLLGQGMKYRNIREAFKALWDSINAKRGFGWGSNPWVWVLDFKRT